MTEERLKGIEDSGCFYEFTAEIRRCWAEIAARELELLGCKEVLRTQREELIAGRRVIEHLRDLFPRDVGHIEERVVVTEWEPIPSEMFERLADECLQSNGDLMRRLANIEGRVGEEEGV